MRTLSIIITVLTMTTSIIGQQTDNLSHYYLKIKGSKPAKFKIEIGTVVYDSKMKPTQVEATDITDISELLIRLEQELGKDGASDRLNVLIHGIWGNYQLAWKEMVKNLTENVYIIDDQKQKVMLSIIWDSSVNYVTGIKIARHKGDFLGELMKSLGKLNNGQTKTTFLCHSMGNRIFQHMITSSGLLDQDLVSIDQYISAGADLESDIFEEDKPLHKLPNIVNDIIIFVHNNDRSLGMSKVINRNKRLGLHGIDNLESKPNNVLQVDVSTITDHLNLPSAISNHRYFYMNRTIMRDIKRMIWNQEYLTDKEELEYPNSVKLTQKSSIF